MRADELLAVRELEGRPDLTDTEHGELELLRLHRALANGHIVSDDILDLVKHVDASALQELLGQGQVLVGGHDASGDPLDALDADVADHLRQALRSLPGNGIWRDTDTHIPQVLRPMPTQAGVPAAWRSATRPLLRRLIVPDPRGRRREHESSGCVLPIVHAGDRRGYLRSLWNPLVPDITWQGSRPRHAGTVQVYLDVSGSMGAELQLFVRLLGEFAGWVRHPLWAFSTVIAPATIVGGELRTATTGGTALSAVIDHIRKTRPSKALIVTDGFVERCPIGRLACHIEALIPANGTPDVLEAAGIPVTRLPPVPPPCGIH